MAGTKQHSAERGHPQSTIERQRATGKGEFESLVRKRGVDVPHANGLDRSDACLAETIEVEIIPRLMLAHRADRTGSDGADSRISRPSLLREDVEEFTRLILLSGDKAKRFVAELVSENVRSETIFLDLLAPCARRLGDLWKEDICDFCQVTLGLGHLHAMLREYGHAHSVPDFPSGEGRRALLTAAPGEQHTFGISMLSEFLTRAGWDIAGFSALSEEELARLVGQESFALVGLSLGAERNLDTVQSCIDAIRRHSRHDNCVVMVGGPYFLDHPEVADQLGADSTASDARDATARAEDLHRSRLSE